MTVKIDGRELNVTHLEELVEPLAMEWMGWENGGYARKRQVYGRRRSWTLTCFERDVDWVESAAKYLQERLGDGAAVSFIVDEESLHQVNTTAYVAEITVEYEAGQNIRYFKVRLVEA